MQRRLRWELKPLPPLLTDTGGSYPIGPEGLVIGRDPECSIVVDGERFPSVSGLHARISWVDKGLPEARLSLEDLGSSNGTLLNGHRVDKAALAKGSVIEIGPGGPRLVVVGIDELAETRAVSRDAAIDSASRSLGATAMRSVKRALGIERHAIEELVATSQRRSARAIGLVALAIVAIVALVLWQFRVQERQEIERLRAENEALRENLELKLAKNQALADELRLRIAAAGEESSAARAEFDAFLGGLLLERTALEQRFDRLESEGFSSASERATLRGQLDETSRRLALFDPVTLNESTLLEVGRVRSSVCLIEASLTWREESTQTTLFLDSDQRGRVLLNLEGRGEPFAQESTGSGFCVSPEGWIVTNAHVAEADEEITPLEIEDFVLVPHVELHVVFSGDETRRKAVLWDVAYDDRDDLALIKIEPFEGLAYLDDFSLDVPRPTEGSAVFLLGFPLGTHALQEGDKVIASTFKGILSRFVDPYLQVDAGVHPGNSGGPISDAQGRVLGIVTAGQRTPDDGIAYTIGYAIPIDRLSRIWPPAPESILERSAPGAAR